MFASFDLGIFLWKLSGAEHRALAVLQGEASALGMRRREETGGGGVPPLCFHSTVLAPENFPIFHFDWIDVFFCLFFF